MFAGILYIWMSTIGVLNHEDDMLYKRASTQISSQTSLLASTDDGCIACQWMVGSLSAAASYTIQPIPVLIPKVETLPVAEAFHKYDFYQIPPRGPPSYS
jgi:hypothetical protein